ncbi:MAG: LysR substrate-binding domain-containing protein [Pseudomonadota bacterium]
MKRIPLNWLQAFEATGRTGSFKAAAEELNVSPSTISHQVRDLEAHLGTLLFSRSRRQVVLTDEGRNLLPDLTLGFESIRRASTTDRPASTRLHIGAFPFLANEIITPNINALRQVLPGAEIRLFTHTDLDALTRVSTAERLDVVVRYGPSNGRIPGFASRKLADVALVPIAGPAADVDGPASLLRQPLIRVLGPFQGWERWLAEFAPEVEHPAYSLETDSFHAAMLAVARNEGVCLGVLPYLSRWIREGKVGALSDLTLPLSDQAAYAVYAPFQASNPLIERFVTWLKDVLR